MSSEGSYSGHDQSNSYSCIKLYRYFCDIYDQRSWWSKLLAFIVIFCYMLAVVVVHDQPYLWLTLTFAVILCLTTLACSREDPIIAFRRGGPSPRPSLTDDRREPPPLEIWVTDIPPTYSFVMGNSTPPPSYGSAILKFPAVAAAAAEKLETAEGPNNSNSTPMLRRVLDPNRFRSVSRQVSEIGRLSRQVSESGIGRLSRQSSINPSEQDETTEDWESGIVIIIPPRLRRTVSQNSETFVSKGSDDLLDQDGKSVMTECPQATPNPSRTDLDSVRTERYTHPHQVFTCNAEGNSKTVIVVTITDYDDTVATTKETVGELNGPDDIGYNATSIGDETPPLRDPLAVEDSDSLIKEPQGS